MERYESYKDSGVKWIGEIPEHWEVKRLGSFFIERRVKVSDKDYAPLSVTKNGIFPQLENVAKTNDGDNRKLVKRNDFVINSRSDRKGSSGVSPLDGSVSLINIVLKPRNTIYPPYCNYLLKSFAFIEEFYRNGRGIVADLWTTRYDEMKIIKMAMPTLSEQTAIANYLDSVTSKIDEAISQQQKMIDLLNERKQIIIQNAVTKGLDPNAKMKDSGVEWIGEIPGHWGMRKMKYTFKERSQKGFAKLPLLAATRHHGVIKKEDYENRTVIATKGLESFKLVCVDDFVISLRSFEAGIEKSYEKGIISPAYTVLEPKQIEHSYFKYLGKSKPFINLLKTMVTGIREGQNIDYNKLRTCMLPIPTCYDQEAIANYLDSETSKLDSSISQCNKMISLLQERKQIIINDVVTGKVKVV